MGWVGGLRGEWDVVSGRMVFAKPWPMGPFASRDRLRGHLEAVSGTPTKGPELSRGPRHGVNNSRKFFDGGEQGMRRGGSGRI